MSFTLVTKVRLVPRNTMRVAKAFQQMKVLKSYLSKTQIHEHECMVDWSVDNKRLNQFAIFYILCNCKKYVWVLSVSQRYAVWFFLLCNFKQYMVYQNIFCKLHNTMDSLFIVLSNIVAMILTNFIQDWSHIIIYVVE